MEEVGLVPTDSLALLLYGSHARGTPRSDSDIDILALVQSAPGSTTVEEVSVVRYLPSQIEEMTQERSLFAWHLASEGVSLTPTPNQLLRILSSHPGPDPDHTLERIRLLAQVLDLNETQFSSAPGSRAIARYLLRGAIYAQAISHGVDTFDTEAASMKVDPTGRLTRLMERCNPPSAMDWNSFQEAVDRLKGLVGDIPGNPHDSLETLVISSAETNRPVWALGLRALIDTESELPYADLDLPII